MDIPGIWIYESRVYAEYPGLLIKNTPFSKKKFTKIAEISGYSRIHRNAKLTTPCTYVICNTYRQWAFLSMANWQPVEDCVVSLYNFLSLFFYQSTTLIAALISGWKMMHAWRLYTLSYGCKSRYLVFIHARLYNHCLMFTVTIPCLYHHQFLIWWCNTSIL